MFECRFLWIALVAVFISSARAEDLARPQAKISASVQGGYARILFDWTDEVTGAPIDDALLVTDPTTRRAAEA